jgi:Nucleoside 2-deoxyribosyltransferase like
MRIFLGGTCNGSTWRDALIPHLKMDYYNPVVPEWTEEAYQRELVERAQCDVCLYVLTPKIHGYYSIAEVADDSNKRPEKTVFCILHDDAGLQFEPSQYRSLQKVGKIVEENGGHFCEGMEALVQHLRSRQQPKTNA